MKPLSLLILAASCPALTLLAGSLAGCASKVSFDSPDSATRIRAIQRAGATNDKSSIPRLIEMLDSDDPAVRLLAIGVLQDMTGQTFEYDAAAPSFNRREAIDRWRQWYESTKTGRSEAAGSGTRPSPRPDSRSVCEPAANDTRFGLVPPWEADFVARTCRNNVEVDFREVERFRGRWNERLNGASRGGAVA